jgi:hypothetical protein
LLVVDLGGDDGEVVGAAEAGVEGEGVERDAVDVLFGVGEGVVDEDACADEEDAKGGAEHDKARPTSDEFGAGEEAREGRRSGISANEGTQDETGRHGGRRWTAWVWMDRVRSRRVTA